MIEVIQKPEFKRAVKKFHANQKSVLKFAILDIMANPKIGEQKLGKLSDTRIYKFKMLNQLTLLAYSFYEEQLILELIKIGPHENFYRDLEKNM